MGHVYNVIISFSVSDVDRVQDITRFFKEVLNDSPPVDLDSPRPVTYGGTKALEKTVMVGAHNYLRLDELVEFMESLGWHIPEDVQLLVDAEDNEPSIFTERLNRDNLKTRPYLG